MHTLSASSGEKACTVPASGCKTAYPAAKVRFSRRGAPGRRARGKTAAGKPAGIDRAYGFPADKDCCLRKSDAVSSTALMAHSARSPSRALSASTSSE